MFMFMFCHITTRRRLKPVHVFTLMAISATEVYRKMGGREEKYSDKEIKEKEMKTGERRKKREK
jgi:hypothetical protein